MTSHSYQRPNQIAVANALRCPFRYRGSRREEGMAQLFTLGIIRIYGTRDVQVSCALEAQGQVVC